MMMILHLILHSAVHTYDFHIFKTSSSSFYGFITNQFNDLLPVGLLAYADHDRYCRGDQTTVALLKPLKSVHSTTFLEKLLT